MYTLHFNDICLKVCANFNNFTITLDTLIYSNTYKIFTSLVLLSCAKY